MTDPALPPPPLSQQSLLDVISTLWPEVNNPLQFVMRYAPAIRRYLTAILKSEDAAEEVSQEFLVKVFDKSFSADRVTKGRFRDYLKASLRYSAMSYLRKRPMPTAEAEQLASLVAEESPEHASDREWIAQWRACLLERVWQSLEALERKSNHCHFHTVLRFVAENPQASSQTVANHVSRKLGEPYRADAARQQFARARRQFADFIIAEVKAESPDPTPDAIEAELIELDLMKYVRDYWKRPETAVTPGLPPRIS